WARERDRFEALARHGQRPRAMIVACSDSRADPQMIFNAAPGELFTVRNVANLVPPYNPDSAYHGTSAALEFGVKALKVEDVVVMGHAMCGGVRALLDGAPEETPDFVAPWMTIAAGAKHRVADVPPAERQHACELETVRLSVANLMSFPWIKDAVAAKTLRVRGAYFDIRSGVLMQLGDDGVFTPVTPQTEDSSR
ncbi:MAG: carbonic anhydrase, partial [Alphaproteobacteria bacterium]|nr:carbonic anhydrase [Alphaproteobacteria bacterium]